MCLQLTGVLLRLANEAAFALKPICRPLWFIDPEDPVTYTICDQYALGDDVIVAPVVEKVCWMAHLSRLCQHQAELPCDAEDLFCSIPLQVLGNSRRVIPVDPCLSSFLAAVTAA